MALPARSWLLVALLIGVLALSGCRQPDPPDAQAAGIEIEVTIEPDPPVTGDSTLNVTVRDASGEPVEEASLNVRGDMTHAGMVPVLRDVEESEGGVFIVPFEWTMSGDWIVDFTVTYAGNQTAQKRLEIEVMQGENATENHNMHAEETEMARDG